MEVSLKGEKVLVTGAGRGIGKDLVVTLVGQSATVYTLTKTEELLNQLKAELPSVIPILVDLRDWEATKKALENIGPVDHLVNIAGVAISQDFRDITPDVFDTMFDVNVRAIINVSRIVA